MQYSFFLVSSLPQRCIQSGKNGARISRKIQLNIEVKHTFQLLTGVFYYDSLKVGKYVQQNHIIMNPNKLITEVVNLKGNWDRQSFLDLRNRFYTDIYMLNGCQNVIILAGHYSQADINNALPQIFTQSNMTNVANSLYDLSKMEVLS